MQFNVMVAHNFARKEQLEQNVWIIVSSSLPLVATFQEQAGVMDMNYIDIYRKTSNISRTLVGNKTVHHSDVVGASPAGAAPTTSTFST